MKDIRQHQEVCVKEGDSVQKKRSLIQIQRGLIKSQEIGDEKLQLVQQIIELIENRTRQLEQDLENLGEFNDTRTVQTDGYTMYSVVVLLVICKVCYYTPGASMLKATNIFIFDSLLTLVRKHIPLWSCSVDLVFSPRVNVTIRCVNWDLF